MSDGEEEAQYMQQAASSAIVEHGGEEEEFPDHEDNNDTTAVVKKKKRKKKKKKHRSSSHMEVGGDDLYEEGGGDYSSLAAANMTHETLEEGVRSRNKFQGTPTRHGNERISSGIPATTPGAVATSIREDRTTANKQTASTNRDVLAKQRGRLLSHMIPVTTPGAAATSIREDRTTANKQTASTDQDVLAKQRGRRPSQSHMIPVTTPGAVAMSIREDRTTVKQTGRTPTDSVAAARAARIHSRESSSTTSSTPPPDKTVCPLVHSANNGVGVIDEEGNDMATRRRPRVAPVATRPGAMATRATADPARRKLSGPGTSASNRRANSGSSPHQLEQDQQDIDTKRRASSGRTSALASNNNGGDTHFRALANTLREDISAPPQQHQQQRLNRASGGGGNTSVASSVGAWPSRGSAYDAEWNSNGANTHNGRTNDPTWDNMSVTAFVTSASITATGIAPSTAVAVADDDPPNYPGTVSVDEFGEIEAVEAVEAYIADHYVEPMAVIPVMSEQEEITQEAQKHRRYVICFACLLVVIVVSIVVPISLTLFKPKKQKIFHTELPSPMPSSVPSTVPSAAPSSQGFVDIMNAVSNITSMDVFMDKSSPQYKAARYMADEDPSRIRPINDSHFLQLYALVTFFFSTNGESWKRCNPGNLCSGPFSTWLSDSDECDWMGILCDADKFLIQINIGTYNHDRSLSAS
eukprot:scaffold12969_cov65-Attheya_sp.AAC.13